MQYGRNLHADFGLDLAWINLVHKSSPRLKRHSELASDPKLRVIAHLAMSSVMSRPVVIMSTLLIFLARVPNGWA